MQPTDGWLVAWVSKAATKWGRGFFLVRCIAQCQNSIHLGVGFVIECFISIFLGALYMALVLMRGIL